MKIFTSLSVSCLMIMLCCSSLNNESQAAEISDVSSIEQVIILHGIARSSSHMEPLAEFIEANGFDVHNIDYPSTEFPLGELVDNLHQEISQVIDPARPVHFIGYSMGGLVTRIYLDKYRPDNLGRVVQLASPNSGSEVADFVKDNWLYQIIYGPAGQQLITDQSNLGGILGTVDYDLGVVAGNFSIDPVSSAIIPGDDDGKVSVESTKVEGMKDHVVVPASHTFFPANTDVQREALHFLQHGAFSSTSEQ